MEDSDATRRDDVGVYPGGSRTRAASFGNASSDGAASPAGESLYKLVQRVGPPLSLYAIRNVRASSTGIVGYKVRYGEYLGRSSLGWAHSEKMSRLAGRQDGRTGA